MTGFEPSPDQEYVLDTPVGADGSDVSRDSTQREDGDIRAGLETLRTHLATLDPENKVMTLPSLEGVLANVAASSDRIATEHAGMAGELLGMYEQLGVVFEVTRKLSTVQNEHDVIDLFIESLRRSFVDRDVFAVRPDRSGDAKLVFAKSSGAGDALNCWLEALVDRAAQQASAVVDHPPPGTGEQGSSVLSVVEALVGPVFSGSTFVFAIVLTRQEKSQAFRASDMGLLESLTHFCGDLIRNHRLLHELRDMSVAMVRSLVSAVDQKDPYTSGHSVRVGYFATLLGEALELDEADLQMLRWSALLHDVGKIGIKDDILNKAGELTEEELAEIKGHPVRSYQVLEEVPHLAAALDGVLYHHEKYDGTGYPEGLAGEEIPLQARIVQVADIFDALTSDRSYRSAHPWRKALDILKGLASGALDPHLQQVFDRAIRIRLDGDPDGWRKLVHCAECFTRKLETAEASIGEK